MVIVQSGQQSPAPGLDHGLAADDLEPGCDLGDAAARDADVEGTPSSDLGARNQHPPRVN